MTSPALSTSETAADRLARARERASNRKAAPSGAGGHRRRGAPWRCRWMMFVSVCQAMPARGWRADWDCPWCQWVRPPQAAAFTRRDRARGFRAAPARRARPARGGSGARRLHRVAGSGRSHLPVPAVAADCRSRRRPARSARGCRGTRAHRRCARPAPLLRSVRLTGHRQRVFDRVDERDERRKLWAREDDQHRQRHRQRGDRRRRTPRAAADRAAVTRAGGAWTPANRARNDVPAPWCREPVIVAASSNAEAYCRAAPVRATRRGRRTRLRARDRSGARATRRLGAVRRRLRTSACSSCQPVVAPSQVRLLVHHDLVECGIIERIGEPAARRG